MRILETEEQRGYEPRERDLKRVRGGLLVQDPDVIEETREGMTVATAREPSEPEWRDLLFSWAVCKHVRSNAIVFAKDGATVGIGAGQMSRVDSVRIAIEKAGDAFGERVAGDARRRARSPPTPSTRSPTGPSGRSTPGHSTSSSPAARSATAR